MVVPAGSPDLEVHQVDLRAGGEQAVLLDRALDARATRAVGAERAEDRDALPQEEGALVLAGLEQQGGTRWQAVQRGLQLHHKR